MIGDVYGTIYQRLERLIPDLASLKPGEARKSEAPGFMALHLDVLGYMNAAKTELRIALHHSYEQNGDLVSDPDMEIRVYLQSDWKRAEALTFQDAYTYREVYRQVFPERGMVDPRAKKDLNSFLAGWLRNCINQGHSLAKKEAVAV